jgi:hypothetical protein
LFLGDADAVGRLGMSDADPPVRIEQRVTPPPPRTVTDKTCRRWTGLDRRPYRKVARAMAEAGYGVLEMGELYVVVLDDLVSFVRAAPPLPIRQRGDAANDETGDDSYRRAIGA